MDLTTQTTGFEDYLKEIPETIHTSSKIQIAGKIAVQVCEILDISTSKYELLQKLQSEDAARGTRHVQEAQAEADQDNTQQPTQPASTKQHFYRLIVQDYRGNLCFAFELKKVFDFETDIKLGTKLILENVESSRGVLMLKPQNTQIVQGSHIPGWEMAKKDKLIKLLQNLLDNEDK